MCSSQHLPYALASDVNAGKRDYQQDRHIAIPDFKPDHGGHDQVNCCLVGVFDGHKSEQAAVLAAAKMPGIIAARKPLNAECAVDALCLPQAEVVFSHDHPVLFCQ